MNIEEKIKELEKRVSILEQQESEKLLTVRETANMLNVSRTIVYDAIRNGTLKAIDCFGVLKVKKGDVLNNVLKIKKYRHWDLDAKKIKNT